MEVTNAADGSSTRAHCLQQINSQLSPISDFEWVVTSTHSHDPTAGKIKYRVTLLPDRDIQQSEYQLVLAALNTRLGGILDTNAWQWSQAFFLPSCPQDAESHAFFSHNPGTALPVDALAAEGTQLSSAPNRNVTQSQLANAITGGLQTAPPETTENSARAKSALSTLDPSMPRAQWLNVIWAVHAHDWLTGYAIARAWSEQSPKFDPRTFDKDWHSFDPLRPDGIHTGSLYYLAKQSGWRDSTDTNTEPGDIDNGRRFAHQQRGRLGACQVSCV